MLFSIILLILKIVFWRRTTRKNQKLRKVWADSNRAHLNSSDFWCLWHFESLTWFILVDFEVWICGKVNKSWGEDNTRSHLYGILLATRCSHQRCKIMCMWHSTNIILLWCIFLSFWSLTALIIWKRAAITFFRIPPFLFYRKMSVIHVRVQKTVTDFSFLSELFPKNDASRWEESDFLVVRMRFIYFQDILLHTWKEHVPKA